MALYAKGSYFSLTQSLKKKKIERGKKRFSHLNTILCALNILVFLLLWKNLICI